MIGCGRVGSAVAHQLREEGWDVDAVDEKEEALGRLGEHWDGGFVVGHGMDTEVLREAGIEEADAVVVATDGDNTNIVVGQVAQKRFGIECVVVRVLDPARADFYASAGCARSARRRRAIDALTEAVARCEIPAAARGRLMYVLIAGGGKIGANLTRSLLRAGHEVTLIEQRRDRFDQLEDEFEHQCPAATPPSCSCSSARASQRPPDLVVAVTGDDEDNIVICQLAREKYGVEKVIARVNDPRNQVHFDLLGISPTVCATSSIMALIEHEVPEHEPHPPARAAQGEPRDRRGADRRSSPCAGKPIERLRFPRARV